METIAEILKYTLPSLITGGVIYYVLRSFLINEQKRALLEMKIENQEIIVPVRMQAYERLVLYLERIAINNLIVRVSQPGMNAAQLQNAMVSAIRDEFEHNLSQQLYVSDKSWDLLVNAKEEMLSVINQTSAAMKPEAKATDYASAVFQSLLKHKEGPEVVALQTLKNEMREQF